MAITTNQPVPASGGPGVILASGSRAVGAVNSAEFFNPSARGIRLYTTNDGAGGSTATAKVQVRDPVTDTWVDLAGAATAALGAVSSSLFTLYPEGVAAANVYVLNILGVSWRVVLTTAVATGTAAVAGEYLI